VIRIRPVAEMEAEVGAAVSRHRRQIAALVPQAEVIHVGSTAIPGALTKGDVDLLVRVAAHEFDPVVRALRSVYAVHQPENWTATYASFVDPAAAGPPVGVQLVVSGGEEDGFFEPFIEALEQDEALLAEYNALKRRLDGADYERYTREKGEFVEWVLSRSAARPGDASG
jgi:GrpB-like predicted nucleotidyltransferase (UPF0157 family)